MYTLMYRHAELSATRWVTQHWPNSRTTETCMIQNVQYALMFLPWLRRYQISASDFKNRMCPQFVYESTPASLQEETKKVLDACLTWFHFFVCVLSVCNMFRRWSDLVRRLDTLQSTWFSPSHCFLWYSSGNTIVATPATRVLFKLVRLNCIKHQTVPEFNSKLLLMINLQFDVVHEKIILLYPVWMMTWRENALMGWEGYWKTRAKWLRT